MSIASTASNDIVNYLLFLGRWPAVGLKAVMATAGLR